MLWSKLKTQKLQLDDLQAYITLRGAQLSSDDKKRIILDSDQSLEGILTVGKVREAVRMLGTSFFQEMMGLGKKVNKTKVYDSMTMFTEDQEPSGDTEDSAHLTQHDEWNEDELLEILAADGDDDAVFITDFEAAASEVIQQDEDLAAAYSTYMEARRRLSEKYRARGFWPISKGKSKGKGRNKGKGPWVSSRKSLQQRILESNCRLCGKKGHWRNECPLKSQGSSAGSSTAAVTLSLASHMQSTDSAMPEEFMTLPEVIEHPAKDILSHAPCFVQSVFSTQPAKMHTFVNQPDRNMKVLRDKIRNHIKGNKGTNLGVQALVNRIEMKLHKQSKTSSLSREEPCRRERILRHECKPPAPKVARAFPGCSKDAARHNDAPVESPVPATATAEAETCFATHDTWGIVDTGATKTVMGSCHVKEFLEGLTPEVKKQVRRSSSNVVFRFGNQGTLKASHAMVVPVCGMWLKISIVEGSTPFLISNTLLRALGAMIDTKNHQLIISKHNTHVPLQLSPKGLYLLDMNKLFAISPVPESAEVAAETYAQDDHDRGQNEMPPMPEADPTKVTVMSPAKFSKDSQASNSGSHSNDMIEPSASESPVIHRTSSADPIVQRFCAQDPDTAKAVNIPREQHGQLCPAFGQGPSNSATDRGRVHRPYDSGRFEGRTDELRKSAHWQTLRRSLDQSSGLGEMVRSPLLQQWQVGASQVDPVHPPQDRRDGECRGPDSDASGQSQERAKVPGSPSQDDANGLHTSHVDGRLRDRLLRGDERDSMDRRNQCPRGDPSDADQDASPGRYHAEADRRDVPEHHGGQPPDAFRSSRNCHSRMGRPMEQLGEEACCSDWSLQAGEIDSFCKSIPNNQQAKFWEHVEMIEKELHQTSKIVFPSAKKLDLLEVFCSPESMLTNQVNQLGGSAKRFGLNQGDLMKPEGRRELFAILIRHQPRHVWMSPTCGPWSKWSQFNCQRSLHSWDQIIGERVDMLIQVALCLVLCRYQHRCRQHAHWEQPKGSLMMKLPQIQEIERYMVVAKPDLCIAGDLTDPQSMQPIKKGLAITTTSQKMHEALDHLRCTQDHVHQVIEGSTVAHGIPISRAQFSELYPRKFARLIAKTILKHRFPLEKPIGSLIDPALLVVDAIVSEIHAASVAERPAKRIRRSPQKGVKMPAATGALAQPGETKRVKLNPKSEERQTETERHPEEERQNQNSIEEILKRIEALLPRVGKKQIDSPAILQSLHVLFPKYHIVRVLAGKGTDRRYEAPKDITHEEAPYRRSIMRLRENQQIILDPAWEKYDTLSKRQVIRKSPACRVNITMFAALKPEDHQCPMPSSAAVQPTDGPADPSEPDGCRDIPSKDANPNNEHMVPEGMIDPKTSDNPSIQFEVPNPSDVPNTDQISHESEQPLADSTTSAVPNQIGLERHGPRFRALPREEQAMIKRAHQNLCHPSPDQLSAVFRSRGCRPEICQAIYDMQCSTCISCQKPKIARPSTLKDALDFNDKVFIDGITWTSKGGTMYHFYHMLDQATNYHVAIPAPSRSADQAVARVSEAWFLWAGPPNTLIMDSATEFTSETFEGFLQRHDVRGITISPHAHWQNGRCERHGQFLQTMLNKIDQDSPIMSYKDLQQALIQCTHAKNSLSIRAGYAPEVLVFGKSSKLPGSIVSSEDLSAHASANRNDAQGIAFRQNLALREKARVAFHQADNDMALRRACLRRTRPDRQGYQPGEWVMMWQPQQESHGFWFGPLKVVQQETNLSVWATAGGKLHRRAPEHVRPVSSAEARQVPRDEIPLDELPNTSQTENSNVDSIPDEPPTSMVPITSHPPSDDGHSQSQDQPDNEPEGNPSESNSHEMTPINPENGDNSHLDTPVPESSDNDELVTSQLLCCDDDDPIMMIDPVETPCAWRCELEVPSRLNQNQIDKMSPDDILLATADKRQRTEVKLSTLNAEERAAFQKAKETEIQNWLTTGTVSKILRSKLAPEQIMRCRWLLVWKDKDPSLKTETEPTSSLSNKLQTHKAKARLVVLGYLDPNLTEVPRDSPTLGRQSKMLLLQLIASCGWTLESFDIRAAFLQGRTQQGRVMGLEPVPELAAAMKLKSDEICKLDKSAYGLIDAPFLWFQTLCEELNQLGLQASPFDPCLFTLRHPETGELCGALGVHVDDGIYGGNEYFHQQIQKLEKKYPFGSKKSKSFTFTGIDMQQLPDQSIQLSQTKYVNNIPSISIKPERRLQEDQPVTEEERHHLRGLVGSLQYAAVHTRPDVSSALSHLQSQINQAKVSTLLTANKVLHSAKKHSDVCIKIQPIAVKDLRFIAFSDASFASKSKPESHAGMIILATHKDISQNKSCAISPISWGTKKIQRIVTSTLSAETTALSTTLDQLTWLRLYWAWLQNPKIEWQRLEKVNNLPPAISIPTYKACSQDLAITDCKSLYDLTTRTAIPNCQEYRTQLLARSIKDILAEGIKLHWVHSGAQLADALTKIMEANFLRETLRQGKYCLHDVAEVLKDRASARNRLKLLRTANDQMCNKVSKT